MLKKIYIIFFIFFPLGQVIYAKALPTPLKRFLTSITYPIIGNAEPNVKYTILQNDIVKVDVSWKLLKETNQNEAAIAITPSFKPDLNWATHLTPEKGMVIDQHVFRSPCIILSGDNKQITLIPDLDKIKGNSSYKWYMDMDAISNALFIGLSKTYVTNHVFFKKASGTIFPKGNLQLSFYLLCNDVIKNKNYWRKPASFFWKTWGKPLYKKEEPLQIRDLDAYTEQTYNWAFKYWKKDVWQEFMLNNVKVGAPVFIVNYSQSPNYKGEVNEREFRSIWNQAWFNSLRSASGLFRYAKRTNNLELLKYAVLTKELALQFPQSKGFFPAIIATEMKEVTINGNTYNRSKGWETKYFGNSNRNPYSFNPANSPYHILDMSFTANQMLNWYKELQKDERLLIYARKYANALINTQLKSGYFPGWLSIDSLKPLKHLNNSPETSMSVTFLLNLYNITKENKYKYSALKAINAVIKNNIPECRWEDFETYWSCSRYGSNDLVGLKVPRNNTFKQNTLGVFYTAEALLHTYFLTNNKVYLSSGQRVLDELLMAQAVWQPPFIPIKTLGGFGVMNADAEWNDSRQSLFAEILLDYGRILRMPEYTERGIAALKASFIMMYSPLNQSTMKQWQQRYPFFGKEDYGFMMENYGHDGVNNNNGLGIGEFTIYDWGNGAAAEAYNRIRDHYPNLFKF